MFRLIWVFISLVHLYTDVSCVVNLSHEINSNLIMLPLVLPAIETYGKNKPEFKNASQRKLNQSSALSGSWETFMPDFLIFGSSRDHKEEVCDDSAA